MFRLSRIGTGVLTAAAFSLSALPVYAEDNWWFDVEVILFDRNTAVNQLQETFELAENLRPYEADIDVIGNIIRPDISWIKQNLAKCDGSDAPLWQPEPSLDEITETFGRWQQQQSGYNSIPDRTSESAINNAPIVGDNANAPAQSAGVSRYENSTDELLSTDTHSLTDEDIASFWVEFSGINTFERVTVPGFRYCEAPSPWMTYSDKGWERHSPDNRLPAPDSIPIELSGHDWPRASQAHLLSSNSRELEKLSEQIRRNRDLTRLLHITWRQEVPFGQEEAPTVRLYAGQNYAKHFTLNGYAIPTETVMSNPASDTLPDNAVRTLTEDTFFTELNTRLSSPQLVPLSRLLQLQSAKDHATGISDEQLLASSDSPIWQLDGYMKVFLKYINRVPYLHIDSEMFYRQPIPVGIQDADTDPTQPEYKLVSVPFKQLRRVISKQLHYFDHPLFGMVVEIRRYERPAIQKDTAQ